MIVVRNVFKIDPVNMKEAKERVLELSKEVGKHGGTYRVMTDVVSEFYTLILEGEYENLGQYESLLSKSMDDKEWAEAYSKVRPMIVGGHREVFSIVE